MAASALKISCGVAMGKGNGYGMCEREGEEKKERKKKGEKEVAILVCETVGLGRSHQVLWS